MNTTNLKSSGRVLCYSGTEGKVEDGRLMNATKQVSVVEMHGMLQELSRLLSKREQWQLSK